MKKKKHNKLIKDYDEQKRRHVEKLATKMLENDEKINKLKDLVSKYFNKKKDDDNTITYF